MLKKKTWAQFGYVCRCVNWLHKLLQTHLKENGVDGRTWVLVVGLMSTTNTLFRKKSNFFIVKNRISTLPRSREIVIMLRTSD